MSTTIVERCRDCRRAARAGYPATVIVIMITVIVIVIVMIVIIIIIVITIEMIIVIVIVIIMIASARGGRDITWCSLLRCSTSKTIGYQIVRYCWQLLIYIVL